MSSSDSMKVETEITELMRYRQPTPVNRTPAKILRGSADRGELEQVEPRRTGKRQRGRHTCWNLAILSVEHQEARDALTIAVQRIRSNSVSPVSPNVPESPSPRVLGKRSPSSTLDGCPQLCEIEYRFVVVVVY